MPYADNGHRVGNPQCGRSSIISNCDDTFWPQQNDKLLQQLFASATFAGVMLPIGKGIASIMRMQREDVPEEDASVDML
ncbi:hypothetical protein WL96_13740 [Burkholderia vietnamiensis]|nr:hypothetical protein WL96_13740 [Burkholderia vietnamiensis]AQT51238.1 hypothetical protein BHQ31_14965 [Burkholderia cenocepacia]